MSQAVDSLIHARWIVTVDESNTVLEEHCLAIQDGRIMDILPTEAATEKYHSQDNSIFPNHALIPGLINCHTHAAMTLFRGLADDLPLMDWLQNHIWPAEAKWVNSDFVADGTELAFAEMLRGGTTCMNDMYFFPDEVARLASKVGMRVCVGLIVIDFPTAWAENAHDYIHKGLTLHDEYRHHPLVHTAFAPHAPYTVSDEPLTKLLTLADELDIPVHMHLHETGHEVQESQTLHGKRPIQRLDELEMISPRFVAVHMTQLEDDEIALFAEKGAHVVHSPESNLKLASGFCQVDKLHKAGVNVALGTDGTASNNDLDMFSEMRTAAQLGKAVAADASALPAEQVLRMATINGAKALGLDGQIGSLEVGKWADITAVDLGSLETQPLYHPVSQLIYATGRDKVTDVWVAGRHLLKDRILTTLDESDILSKAKNWQSKIRQFD